MARPRKKATKKVVKKVVKKKKKGKREEKKVDESLQNKGAHTSIAQVEAAIRYSNGFMTTVAEILGITRQAVWKRIKNSERLQEVLEDVEEKILDVAESKLVKAINAGKRWAITYYLERKGKKRGYVPRQEITGKEGKPLPVKLEIERFVRGKLEKEK